jgi:hypothetical protein
MHVELGIGVELRDAYGGVDDDDDGERVFSSCVYVFGPRGLSFVVRANVKVIQPSTAEVSSSGRSHCFVKSDRAHTI